MTMYKALYPRNDFDRLYVSRNEGGWSHSSIADNVDASIQRLEGYKEKHEEDWLQPTEKILTKCWPTELQ